MPKYSVVIPTRDRFAYLNSAIESCLTSDRSDIEVIVSINGNITWSEVLKTYAPVNDSRVHYILTGQLLSMQQSFNFAIMQARGKYVTSLGDDDALLPSAFEYADYFFNQYPDIPLCWFRRPYFWPDYQQQPFSDLKANTLHCWRKISLSIYQTKPILEICRVKNYPYHSLPSVYNSFYPSALLDRLRSAQAELEGNETQRSIFLKEAQSMDVFSAYASVIFMEVFGTITIPLSLSGISAKSNGMSFLQKEPGLEYQRYLEELQVDQHKAIMTGPFAAFNNPAVQIYNDACKALLAYSKCAGVSALHLDYTAIAQSLLDSYVRAEYVGHPWSVYEMMKLAVHFNCKQYLGRLHEISNWYVTAYVNQLESWWKNQKPDGSTYAKISDEYLILNCAAADVTTSAQAALLYQKVLEGKMSGLDVPQ